MKQQVGQIWGTRQLQDDTIKRVVELAVEGSLNPYIKALAERVISDRNIPGKDEVEKVFYVAQKSYKYHKDPVTGEVVVAPWVAAEKLWDFLYERKHQPIGDCDDKTTFLMAMLLHLGYKTFAVGAWQTEYSNYEIINHVYPMFKDKDGMWYPLEPSSLRLKAREQSKAVIPLKRYVAEIDGVKII